LSCAQAQAADDVLGQEAAKAIPVVDAHFHVMTWMDVPELVRYMDRNSIRWAGGGGIVGGKGAPGVVSAKHAEAVSVLGGRYIRPTGMGYWFSLHGILGAAALENPDTPEFKQRLSAMEADLRDHGARVIGELHVNGIDSSKEPGGRFKIKGDAPTLKALFDLAGKYNKPLSIHAQWDPDTAQEVERLVESNRSARLVLAHCGNFATPSEIRGVFERHSNVSCDLAYRGTPPLRGRIASWAAFDGRGIRGGWKKLIEDYPDRFIVGVDNVYSWAEYEEVVQTIRFGLLANLSPATAEKLAYKNAQILFGLK
jgi:predicted TIM-barrel fold metal-dependent hydrolase